MLDPSGINRHRSFNFLAEVVVLPSQKHSLVGRLFLLLTLSLWQLNENLITNFKKYVC